MMMMMMMMPKMKTSFEERERERKRERKRREERSRSGQRSRWTVMVRTMVKVSPRRVMVSTKGGRGEERCRWAMHRFELGLLLLRFRLLFSGAKI